MILYLSGPITGVQDYFDSFWYAELDLERKGHVVLNPAALPEGLHRYEDYLVIDSAMLAAADGIVMLSGWKKSRGARHELRGALRMRKKVFFGAECVPERKKTYDKRSTEDERASET